jgi:hypothetical protein
MRVFLSEVFGRIVNTEHNNRGMPLLCGSGFSEKLNSSNLLPLKCMSHFNVPSILDSPSAQARRVLDCTRHEAGHGQRK